MKAVWIILLILLITALISWVRDDATDFHIVHTLPFLGGQPPSFLWDGAALAMIAITIWGICRLMRRG